MAQKQNISKRKLDVIVSANRKRRQTRASRPSMLQSNTLSLQLYSGLDPFPTSLRRKLRYCDLYQLATGAAGIYGAEQRLRLNGVFDPDYTGTGHQPYGYDQFNTIYSKVRVDACEYKISFTTPGGAADILCASSIAGDTSASLASLAPARPLEWPNATHGHLSSAGQRVCVLKGKAEIHKLLGVTKTKYVADDTYASAVGASPSQLCLLSIATASYSGQGSEAVSVLVEVEYEVVFYERVVQSQS